MDIKLYTYFRSSASYRVRICLNILNLNYESIAIHLLKDGGQNKSVEYKALNPMAQVPYLIDTNNFASSQSMAIMMYLDRKYPGHNLFDFANLQRSTQIIEVCEVVNSGIQPLMNIRGLNFMRDHLGLNDLQRQQWLHYHISSGLEALENFAKKYSGKYFIGDQISAADICLIPQLFGAKRFNIGLEEYPNLLRIENECLKIDAFIKAQPHLQADAE